MAEKIIANFMLNQESGVSANFSLRETEKINAVLKIIPTINEHNLLVNRDLQNQHPISAITGLETQLNNKLSTDTKYGSSLSLTINDQTYILTAQLKDQNGDNLGTAQTVDLPLETMVVGAEYDEDTKELVLTLKNGQTVRFSIADLVSGLQPTLTAGNGINISENTVSNTGLTSATYDADNENLVLVGG